MNGLYRYRVEISEWQCWLITPLPIFGLEDEVTYPMTEWRSSDGAPAFAVFVMPDGTHKRVMSHLYQLDVDSREQEKW